MFGEICTKMLKNEDDTVVMVITSFPSPSDSLCLHRGPVREAGSQGPLRSPDPRRAYHKFGVAYARTVPAGASPRELPANTGN